jgi:hypothetical protein
MSTAKKHHYIPQAFIRGFQGDDEFYYVYNKKKDGLKLHDNKYHNGMDRCRSSDSIFFEWNRNTMTEMLIDNNPLILETSYYKYFDDRFDSAIKALRDKPLEEARQSTKYSELVNFMIVTFLRVPKFDEALKDAARHFFDTRYKIHTPEGIEVTDRSSVESYKQNESFLKEMKFYFIDEVMEINIEKHKGKNMSVNIASSDKNLFLLGDMPMVYPNGLIDLESLGILAVIFPISGKRVYYNFNLPRLFEHSIPDGRILRFIITYDDFNPIDHYLDINALIIDQSVEMICGPDKQVLEESVKHYKKLKANNQLDKVRQKLFIIRKNELIPFPLRYP